MSKNKTILFTTNLERFKLHPSNRKIEDAKSKRLIDDLSEDMKVNGFRFTEPLIVTTKDWVADGQHRLSGAMKAGVGVYYIVDEKIPNTSKGIFEAFIRYNKHKKIVRKNDYVHGYASQGNENFKILEDFGEKFPMFTLTERMMFLRNSGTKHAGKESFQAGKFEVESVRTAEKWANQILQLKPYFEKGFNKSQFVRAILTIMEKKREFKFEEFLHKVKLRPTSIKLCGDKRAYCEMIEEIYNYRRKNEDKLNLRF